MEKLKFYKETSGRWYVDLPTWTGDKSELEMVYGADTMLDFISEGEDHVWMLLSVDKFDNSDELKFIRLATELENGAFYEMKNYRGFEINLTPWLCDVTKFVFGDFPEVIYFSKIN